jgi:hypothetical protein
MQMDPRDRMPPHFHAVYGGSDAIIAYPNGSSSELGP